MIFFLWAFKNKLYSSSTRAYNQYKSVQQSYSTIKYSIIINATPYSVTQYHIVQYSAKTVQADPLLLLSLLLTYHREFINIFQLGISIQE